MLARVAAVRAWATVGESPSGRPWRARERASWKICFELLAWMGNYDAGRTIVQ